MNGILFGINIITLEALSTLFLWHFKRDFHSLHVLCFFFFRSARGEQRGLGLVANLCPDSRGTIKFQTIILKTDILSVVVKFLR